jgi:hypothetical protein
MNDRDERLRQFFGGYFHQDWDAAGAASWPDVVDAYLRDRSVAHATTTRDDLLSWLANTETGLPAELGCDYWPGSATNERTWVRAIADYIDEKIANRRQ